MRTRLLASGLLASALPALIAAAPALRRQPAAGPAVLAATSPARRAPAPEPVEPPQFTVIVHPANAAASITRKQLADLFLKKVTRWPDGATVHPVEPPEGSVARAYFLSDVMGGKSAFAMKLFWNRRILSGREVPPLEKASDEEVVAFVRATPGAVGYLLAATPPGGVKVLKVTD